MSREIAFHRPSSLAKVGIILAESPEGKILAGGTDLMVRVKNGLHPNLTDLIDIGALDLTSIVRSDDRVVIGTACTMNQLAENPIIREQFPTLVSAVLQVGAPQIRNVATIGGNVGNASPAGDGIPALMALEAEVKIRCQRKSRKIGIDEFFSGPGKTVLQRGEFIEAFEIPDRKTKGIYIKLGERRAHAISKVSLAIVLWEPAPAHHCVRIAVGAAAPTVIRCRKAEELLQTSSWPPSNDALAQAKSLVCEAVSPIDDVRSMKGYRKKMTGVLLERAIQAVSK